MTIGETEGLTKIISDAESGTVLGVHIIGPHASDLIAEGALARSLLEKSADVFIPSAGEDTLVYTM